MKIKVQGGLITIITSDGRSFDFQVSQFKELYKALKIINDLVNLEGIESIDYDSIEARKIYELTDLSYDERINQ